MKRVLVLAVVAACGNAPDHALPGASPMPALSPRGTAIACGEDVWWSGGPSPDLEYSYAYDDRARLVLATGVFTDGGADDDITYAYDNAGHTTHMFDDGGAFGQTSEMTASYDTLGDLVDYTNTSHYVFSGFTDTGQPTRELVDGLGYTLDYDARGRLSRTVADTGSTTTYTYDDSARTLVIDTDAGRFHGEIVYGDGDHELSETWGGSDPQAVPEEIDYEWQADRMLSFSFQLWTTDGAGNPVDVYELHTYRYDCAAAR